MLVFLKLIYDLILTDTDDNCSRPVPIELSEKKLAYLISNYSIYVLTLP